MFGIGKKEAGKAVVKEDKKAGSEEKIQFDFEENDRLPFDDEEGFADEDFEEEYEEPQGKLRQLLSQRKTLLLLLLLLLALAGGGYFYLNSTPPPPPPRAPAVPVKSKVVVQPAQPAPIAVTAVAPAPTAAPATAPPVPSVPAPSAPAAAPATTPVPAPKSQPAAVTKEEQAAPAAVATAPVAPVTKITTTGAKRSYTLVAGAFAGQANQQEAIQKIRRLGFTPNMETTQSTVEMTRLLLGIYDDPAAAQARKEQLSSIIPGIFILKQDGQLALYAGSYQDPEKARKFAAQLGQQGILVDEETTMVRMPLKRISFGSFSSREAAEKAAKKAGAAGLPAQVVKR